MINPSLLKEQFLNIINSIEVNRSDFVINPYKDMSRNRKCNFKDTILTTLCFSCHSLNNELKSFFGFDPEKLPSKSAYCQQRSKFNESLFPHFFSVFNESIPFTKKLKDFHLLAIDGTDVNLPTDKTDNTTAIPFGSTIRPSYQFHINALYDLLEQRYVDLLIQPRPDMNETYALKTMSKRLKLDGKSIFIGDRLYPSFNLMANIINDGQYFLFRTKSPQSTGSFLKSLELPVNEEFDVYRTFSITRSRQKKYQKNPQKYKILHNGRTFDFINPDDHTTVYELNIRLVCVKLDEDSYEYLVTNLSESNFSSDELKVIYGLRWGIESSFRKLKYSLGLSYFHAKKHKFIIQEIYAKMIMYNLTSLMTHSINKNHNPKNKWTYKISFEDAVSTIREYLKTDMTESKIKALLLKYVSAVRPDRHIHRHVRTQSVKPLNNRA